MGQWPDVGKRIRERLLEAGYEKNGKPDVMRFCLEKRFFPQYVYKWINSGVLPERDNLFRLAESLGVTPQWLFFGGEEALHGHGPSRGKVERRQGRRTTAGLLLAFLCGSAVAAPPPSASVPAGPGTIPVVQVPGRMTLIRRWSARLTRRVEQLLLSVLPPAWCPA